MHVTAYTVPVVIITRVSESLRRTGSAHSVACRAPRASMKRYVYLGYLATLDMLTELAEDENSLW